MVLAAHRARVIASSKTPLIRINGSKLTVVALREIAGNKVQKIELENDLVESLQTQIEADVPEPTPPAPTSDKAHHQSEPDREEAIRFDLMSEEELIDGLKGIIVPEREEEYL